MIAPNAAPFEARLSRRKRIARVVLALGLLSPMAAMAIAYFGFAPPIEGSLEWLCNIAFALTLMSCVWLPIQVARQPDLLVRVDQSGFSVVWCLSFWRRAPLFFPWSAMDALQRSHRKRWLRAPEPVLRLYCGKTSTSVSLKPLPQFLFEDFEAALRRFWPDLDDPIEQQQHRRNGLDSSP